MPVDRRAVPRWAQALDAMALLSLAGALFVAVAGRVLLLRYGSIVLPAPPAWLGLSALLLVVRHAALRQPGTFASVAAWRARLDARPHLAAAVRAFAYTRPMVFVVAYFAVVTIGLPPQPVGFQVSSDPLTNLPARFDAGWYGNIAQHGYAWDQRLDRQRNIAFFPALPVLMRPVGSVIGARLPTLSRDERMARMLWAGVIVSLGALLWALVYLARLADLLAGARAAQLAPMLLASYPFAVFFNAPYSESLFLLGAVGAFYHFHRGQWWRAAAWGLLAGFSRPNGCLLSVPLAILAVQQVWQSAGASAGVRGGADRLRLLASRLLVAATPGLAMLVFTVYLRQLTGVWFVWTQIHGAWGRAWGTRPLEQGWEWLTTEGLMAVAQGVPYDTLNTLPALLVLALTWPIFRRLGAAYGAFVLLNLVPPILAGGALSLGRITATIFPVFVVLSVLLPRRAVPGAVAAFALLQGLIAVLFFTWREMF